MTTSTLLLTIFVASIAPSPTPAPSPSPSLPPEIIHTVTSETCTTLQRLMLPVGFQSKSNDQAFAQMAGQMHKFLQNIQPGDDPNIQRPDVSGGTSSGMGPARNNNGTGSATGAALSATQQDDPLTSSPQQIINAAKVDRYAQQIYQNVKQERQLLQRSYAEYPTGHDEKLDRMRQQTSDLMEVQDALADRYENFAETMLSNLNEGQMKNNSSVDIANYKLNLRALILGSTVDLDTDPNKHTTADNFGFKDIKDLAKNGSSAQVLGSLRYNEIRFTLSLFDTYNQCHGTHYVIPTPAPSAGHER